MALRRVCVFSGSSTGVRAEYGEAATALGAAIAARGQGLVFGGAGLGLMRCVADACQRGGGQVIGVIPSALVDERIAHPGVDDLRVVDTMHERKALMGDLADGFVALPGGFGTLEELGEVLTGSQLGLHRKPVALLDVGGFWTPLLELLDGAVAEGFLHPAHRELMISAEEPEAVLDALDAWRPGPHVRKWAEADLPPA